MQPAPWITPVCIDIVPLTGGQPRCCLICCNGVASSIVVKSPGSRFSQTACIARRNSLPLRVLGSKLRNNTRDGLATAPNWLSTSFMISPSNFKHAAASPSALASFATTNAMATWPFKSSATPTTATSATFGWLEMLSSISRVPKR